MVLSIENDRIVIFDIDGTLILTQSGAGSNGNEGVLHIPQSSRTGASPSDGVSYPSAEVQLVYSIIPADRAM